MNKKMINIDGIITKFSEYSVPETLDRLENALIERGTKVYVRIDQQAEARSCGIQIPPLEFLLFGNPEKGARLMAADPMISLDLPLKLICLQDDQGRTCVVFNDYQYIGNRYHTLFSAGSPLDLAPLVSSVLDSNEM